jgi:hypothetical protein
MSNLNTAIEHWATMSFKENPYGDPIPEKYLYDSRIMRTRSKKKNLSECMQDGYVLSCIFNESSKTSDAEAEETIQFSEVFHRLESSETLCPSNFIVEVVNALEAWDADNNTRHSDEFFCKTIARSMRTFASMLREQNLREIINDFLKVEAFRRSRGYKMMPPSVKEDVYGKADITVKYGGAFYRIWSYQVTAPGIEKTSNRILKGGGRGLNITMPFDIADCQMVYGWALYNPDFVKNALRDMIVVRKAPAQSYSLYRKKVFADKTIVKIPAIFDVA